MTDNQAGLRPVILTLFPSMDSLDEVVSYAESKLPVMNKNELISVLFCYHNTMLKVMK